MANIHDSGYKILFSNKTIFRELLETFVDQPWVARLDFDRAERLDKSFISEHYKETESDLIYRLPLDESEVYIYVLLEFQSTVDRWMALRILNYITNFYMDWVGNHPKAEKVPPVFPVLLYNGDARWTAAQTMTALMDPQPDLGEYAISFRYFKIAENEYSLEQLLGIRNIVSTLFLAESRYDLDLLVSQLLMLFERAEDKQAISLFLNWFKQLAVHGRIDEGDYTSFEEIYRSTKEVEGMLLSALAQEKKRFYEQGLEEGREEGFEEGREEGLEEGRIAIVLAMYARGFDLATISDITELEIEKIKWVITQSQDQTGA